MADQTGDGTDPGERNSLDLDALAVSDRFRLFNFTRRDDHVAYLWVLRALDRLRAVHQVQAHSDEVAAALAELARRLRRGAPAGRQPAGEAGRAGRRRDGAPARGRLAGGQPRPVPEPAVGLPVQRARLPRVRGRRGRARARIRDANLSRLVFSDILDDLQGARRGRPGPGPRSRSTGRLSRLDTVLDDMSRRAAQFHLTLGEIIRSTDTSPETFLRYKNALLTHMTDFMAELDRYLPRLAAAVAEAEAAAGTHGPDAMLAPRRPGRRAPVPRPRRTAGRLAPPLDRAARLVRRRPAPARRRVPRRGPAHRHPRRRLRRHRAAPPGHRGAARRGEPVLPAPPPRRVGVQHARTRAPPTR